MSDAVLSRLHECGVVAVVRLDDLSRAVDLSQALLAGGVTGIEFTLTNPDAPRTVAAVRAALGDACVVGAGSVITTAQTAAAVDAGAQFIVSPVTDISVMEFCLARQVPVMPGAYTPTEIQTAWALGAAVVKVFPARALGPGYISDLLAPLPHLRLMPTGGVDASNAGDYIRAGVFAVGVGGSLVDKSAIAAGDWDAIREQAQQIVSAVRKARGS